MKEKEKIFLDWIKVRLWSTLRQFGPEVDGPFTSCNSAVLANRQR